ncbi:MAG: hypothetical protein R3D80_17345 [Paracoccaceae bacterium]
MTEINAAMNQLDQVTQQNAAMFEETTAATHALTREAEALTRTTTRFQTGDTATAGLVAVDFKTAAGATRAGRTDPARAIAAGNARTAPAQSADSDDWDEF